MVVKWLSKKNRKTFNQEGDAVLYVHNVLQLSNLFLCDLAKLRDLTQRLNAPYGAGFKDGAAFSNPLKSQESRF